MMVFLLDCEEMDGVTETDLLENHRRCLNFAAAKAILN